MDLENQMLETISEKKKIDLEERKFDNTWTSCCLRTDKRAVVFFSQLTISLIVIFFCVYQLIHVEECEAQSLYSSILTLVLGTFLPSPKISK